MKNKIKAQTIFRVLVPLSLLIGGFWGYSAGRTENLKNAARWGIPIEEFKKHEAYARDAFAFTARGMIGGYVFGFLAAKGITAVFRKRLS